MMAHAAAASFRFAVPFFAVAGFLLGVAYFVSLRRVATVLVARRAWSPYALSAIARIGATVLFLTFAARSGAPTLLAAFAGFLAARHLTMRSARGSA
jgi:F1F0 ATPase subunit 2